LSTALGGSGAPTAPPGYAYEANARIEDKKAKNEKQNEKSELIKSRNGPKILDQSKMTERLWWEGLMELGRR